jgi:4-hydroxy-tetrahydrodipicolinate synthase
MAMNTTSSKFTGIHSALVTPFNQKGELDLIALSELIALQKVDGIHGIVLAGTTGEAPTLTMDERQEMVRAAKESAGSMVITAGAGSNCTKDAIEMQKAMEDAGADATLQVVPYYNKPTKRGLKEHFSAIAKSARKPVILYNAAGRTGIDIAPETVAVLAKEHDNIIGIKDANTNMERLSDLMMLTKEARPDFLVLCGEDSAFLPYLALGADGIISVVSQVATTEMLALYRAAVGDDLVYAQKIARKLNGFCKLMFSHTNPIPIKTVLAAMGLMEKSFRLPLCPLSPDEEAVLLKKCHDFSYIKNLKARGLCE